jgi:hypothetical protein
MNGTRRIERTARRLVAGGLLLTAIAVPAEAQEDLTVERIFATDELTAKTLSPTWMPDGRHWSVVEADSLDRDELWQVDAETGRRAKLISAAVRLLDGRRARADLFRGAAGVEGSHEGPLLRVRLPVPPSAAREPRGRVADVRQVLAGRRPRGVRS